MSKIEIVKELTEQSTDNYKTYLMSDGSEQMVFTPATPSAQNQNDGIMLLSEDSEVTAGANAEINIFKFANGVVSQPGPDFDLEVGNVDGDVRRVYLNFSLSELPRNPRIKKVELCLPQTEAPTVTLAENEKAPRIALYMLTSDIVEGEGAPSNTTTISDFDRLKLDGSEYRFDITRVIEDAGTTNVGFVLRLENESAQAVAHISDVPTICVNYESNFGTNAGYRSHTQDLGFFGQGAVDLMAKNLTFDCTDFAWAGNRMPVTIKHQYTSALSDLQYTFNSSVGLKTANFGAMKVGLGWRLNLMQSMSSYMIDADNAGFIYVDEDGAERVFKECTYTLTRENETQYTPYECDTDSSMLYDPEYEILSMGDEKYYFNAGRLIKIQNSYGDSIDITYQNNQLTKVTDGVGREFNFTYNDSGYLTEIAAPDGSKLTYTYSAGRLATVTYPTGEKAEITYYGYKPRRVNLIDKNGNTVYSMKYIFSSNNVTETQEFGFKDGVEVAGARSVYTNENKPYRMKITTTQPAQSSDESDEVTVTYFTFDADGNVVGEYMASEALGNIEVDDSQSGIYPVSDSAAQVTNVTNLLRDHNLSCLDESVAANVTEIEEHAKFGKSIYRAENTDADSDIKHPAFSEVTLPAGEYTFSAYVKPTDNFAVNCGAYLAVTTSFMDEQDNERDRIIACSEIVGEYTGEYTRLVLPFTLSEETAIKARLCVKGKGVAYFDAAQLENNPFVSPYNMLINGNFELGVGSNNEAFGWNPGSTSMASKIGLNSANYFSKNYSLDILTDLDHEDYMYQDVEVKSAADTRETFTLGGWAQGYSTVIREREGCEKPRFCLKAEIIYKDGTTEPYTADFTPGTRDWQFSSVSFSKSEMKEVEKLRIYCDYSYNTSMAYFDDIFLIRDSIETELSASDFASGDYEESENGSEETLPDTMKSFDVPEFEELLDEWGNSLTETTFTDGEFGTIYRSFRYNKDEEDTENKKAGNYLVEETDARGNSTEYEVDEVTSRNEEVIDRCGNKTAYEYDAKGRTTKVTSKTANDTEIANVSYTYDAFDNLSEIVRGDGMKYVLNYNAFHNLESIGIDGKTDGNLISYTYKNGSGRLKELAYANADKMKATYNSYGQLVSETWTNSENVETSRYKYAYDGQGNIVRSIDIKALKEYTYYYEDGSLIRSAEYTIALDENEFVTARTLVSSISYVYNEGNLIRKHIEFVGGEKQVIYYENSDDNNSVVKFEISSPTEQDPNNKQTVVSHSKTDSFGRKIFDEIQFGSGVVSRNFTYHTGDITAEHKDSTKIKSSPTTQLVKEITYPDGSTLTYNYDNEERITSVVHKYKGSDGRTVTDTTTYTYDALGQLCEEEHNDIIINQTYYGSTGCYGNILYKNGVEYEYDSVWKDKLIRVGDKTITYDAQGNPTNYFGSTLTWEKGRQLKSFGQESFEYNANGIRTFKTGHSENHYYTLEGTKILKDSWTQPITKEARTIIPLYDNEDSVCGIVYNNIPYYFYKNLQGDIIAIVDANGNTVGRYSYDAWGVPTILENTSPDFVASCNPFLYRGYYYDWDTGLYYLQSRYYDPTTGRFINGDVLDVLLLSSKYNLSTNLYTYVGNNPVKNKDSEGKIWANIICGLIGAAISVLMDFVISALAHWFGNKFSMKKFKYNLFSWQVATTAASGFASGLLMSSTYARWVCMLGSGIISGLTNIINCIISKKKVSFLDLAMDIAFGVIWGYLGGAGVGRNYYVKSIFRNGGYFEYKGYSYSTRHLKLLKPVIKDFAKAFATYARTLIYDWFQKFVKGKV